MDSIWLECHWDESGETPVIHFQKAPRPEPMDPDWYRFWPRIQAVWNQPAAVQTLVEQMLAHYDGLPPTPARAHARCGLLIAYGTALLAQGKGPEGWTALLGVLGPEHPQASMTLQEWLSWIRLGLWGGHATSDLGPVLMMYVLAGTLAVEPDETLRQAAEEAWPGIQEACRTTVRTLLRQHIMGSAKILATVFRWQPPGPDEAADREAWLLAAEVADSVAVDFDLSALGSALEDQTERVHLRWVDAGLTWHPATDGVRPSDSTLATRYQAAGRAADRWRMQEALFCVVQVLQEFDGLAAPTAADRLIRGAACCAWGILLGWLAVARTGEAQAAWDTLMDPRMLEFALPVPLVVLWIQVAAHLRTEPFKPERRALVDCLTDMVQSIVPSARQLAETANHAVSMSEMFARPRPAPPEPHPCPSQASLSEWLSQADRVRVSDAPFDGGRLLLDTREPAVLSTLAQGLDIHEDPATFGHCMCDGEERIEWWSGDQCIVEFSLHHGVSIRSSRWQADAMLVDGGRLVAALAAHGVPGPQVKFLEDQRRAAEEEAKLAQWQSAIPACLRRFWPRMAESGMGWATFTPDGPGTSSPTEADTPMEQEMLRALGAVYPVASDQARSLLAWYGSPTHELWSGYPSYEDVPADLLMLLPTATLIEALVEPLSRDLLEGAARLFAGKILRQRPGDLRLLPSELRQRLLAHSLQSTHADKVARARNALG